MKPHATRLANLKLLIEQHFDGVAGRFADAIGKRRPLIYRIISVNAEEKKNIGESLARDIEAKLGYPAGWLDVEHSLDLPAREAETINEPTYKRDDALITGCLLTYIEPSELNLLHHYRRTNDKGRKLIDQFAANQATKTN